MAPAGLYTFYRAIMTVSNEVKSSPPSTVSFAVRSLFATLSLCLYSFCLAEKESKKKKKTKKEMPCKNI